MLPSISVDQYAATLGRWFGLDDAQLLDSSRTSRTSIRRRAISASCRRLGSAAPPEARSAQVTVAAGPVSRPVEVRSPSRRRLIHREQVPRVGDAFERVHATVFKTQAEPATRSFTVRETTLHPAKPRWPRARRCAPRCRHLVAHRFAFAGVQPGSNFQCQRAQRRNDVGRTAYSARRPSKVAKKPSPAVSTMATMARQLLPHDLVVLCKQLAPTPVALAHGPLGRADMSLNRTVASTRSVQPVVRYRSGTPDLVDDDFGVVGPGQVIVAGQLDIGGRRMCSS